MGKYINIPQSTINDTNLLQLADDSCLLAEEKNFLTREFEQVLKFSKDNYMSANIDKTVFLELSDNNDTDPIMVGSTTLKSAKSNEYDYLGMKFIASNNIISHIKRCLKDRMFHTSRYFEWLDINEETPITIKLQTLYSCMFAAYTYGAEAWWKIDQVGEELLALERKMLKKVLNVKHNTPNDLIYIEIERMDIVAAIKQRQKSLFKRILELREDEAIVKKMVNNYPHIPMINYYENLDEDILRNNKEERNARVQESTTSTYIQQYKRLIDVRYNHVIYYSYLPEYIRTTITKWRLSCHELMIEKGRREIPKLAKHLRICSNCLIMEDEEHAIYSCPLYNDIRTRFREHLIKYPINKILNPINVEDAHLTGNLLNEIEKRRKELGLQ